MMQFAAMALCLLLGVVGAVNAVEIVPRPEHPRPDRIRNEWMNLNGVWEFAETDNGADVSFLNGRAFPDKIKVPFCRESRLSGLGRTGFVKNVWYRRTFERPAGWTSERTLLHIGACDWKTTVWVNGRQTAEHIGGQVPVSCDISAALKSGVNTVIIHAFDDTRSGLQALGKQCTAEKSEGCSYTRTTGIWQTVWLEGVGSSYIRDMQIGSDPDQSRFIVHSEVSGDLKGLTLAATAFAGKKEVATASVSADAANSGLILKLSEKRLWMPKTPFLYDIKLTLKRGSKTLDSLTTYAGLRKIEVKGSAILINGKPIFQRLVLDQGFYPEGVWTAPTDADLKHDIELGMGAGFNGARLHQKVFDPRYLYWADKLGYLVWGEYPNWGLNYAKPDATLPVMNEWVEAVRRDINHPSIVGWCPFNESAKEAIQIQNDIVEATRKIDSSRPIIDSSGWVHGSANPEVLDAHDYDQNPDSFRKRWVTDFASSMNLPARYGGASGKEIPFMVSEFGGIGWATESGWSYGNAPKTLGEFYTRFKGLTDALLDSPHMFGFCYTQLTDVEQEKNGIYTYERKPKFDKKRIHSANARPAAFEIASPKTTTRQDWNVLVGAGVDGAQAKSWRYSTVAPANGWIRNHFDDAAWSSGMGGFGLKEGWETRTRTPWTTKDIWMRQEVSFDKKSFKQALLVLHYDNAAEVYVNGNLIWNAKPGSWNSEYQAFDVTKSLQASLKPGENQIAVHCHQDDGGQFIDLAILLSE